MKIDFKLAKSPIGSTTMPTTEDRIQAIEDREEIRELTARYCHGIAAGEWLHHRVSERRFRDTLFGLLLVAATTLLIKALA